MNLRNFLAVFAILVFSLSVFSFPMNGNETEGYFYSNFYKKPVIDRELNFKNVVISGPNLNHPTKVFQSVLILAENQETLEVTPLYILKFEPTGYQNEYDGYFELYYKKRTWVPYNNMIYLEQHDTVTTKIKAPLPGSFPEGYIYHICGYSSSLAFMINTDNPIPTGAKYSFVCRPLFETYKKSEISYKNNVKSKESNSKLVLKNSKNILAK